MTGFAVRSWKNLSILTSSSWASRMFAGLFELRCGTRRSRSASSAWASLSPPFAFFWPLSMRFWTASRSARTSSVVTTSMSRTGSTEPIVWMTSASSKQRTTWTIASTSRMLARNWLPRPSPLLAPATSPAMSTNSIAAGMTTFVFEILRSTSSRSSGTVTTPMFGSIVQKG